MTDWMTAQLAKAGIKALDQGNSTFTAGVKGIRIVVCVLCIPRFVLRDNRPSWADLGLWSQPITKALPLELRQQFTDCHQFQMVKHQLKLSILQRFVMKWLVWEPPVEVWIASDPHRWKTHTVRWSEWGNKWRWLRPFRVGNKDPLHWIPNDLVAALNESLCLNALSGLKLHANLQIDLWPKDNGWAVLREGSQRFSPGF